MRKTLSLSFTMQYITKPLCCQVLSRCSRLKKRKRGKRRKQQNMKFFSPQIAKNGVFSLDKPAPMEYDRSITFIMAKNSYQ